MFIIEIIKNILYFVLIGVCAYTDFKSGKIYNKNLIRFIFAFLILHIVGYIVIYFKDKNSINEILLRIKDYGLGFLLAFAIGFVFYLFGVFKGGDAKLIAIVGLCSGLGQLFKHLELIVLVAGIAALYVLLKNKILLKRFKRI